MRIHSAILTILACSVLSACGGEKAAAERERPKDFRTAADEVCREHNMQVRENRDEVKDKRVTFEEAVAAIREEARIKEDELRDLRALNPPPEAKPYLDRLRRNAEGMERTTRELQPDDNSYNTFWATLQNSDGLARDKAEALDLKHCSPVTTGY